MDFLELMTGIATYENRARILDRYMIDRVARVYFFAEDGAAQTPAAQSPAAQTQTAQTQTAQARPQPVAQVQAATQQPAPQILQQQQPVG